MNQTTAYHGSCFCGTVRFTVTGTPEAMGYCHCESCRHWSAGPINAFTLWNPEALHITHGADRIGAYNKTPGSTRQWCRECGGHVFTNHPEMGLIDVYAAVLPDFLFDPAVHVNYQEAWVRVHDGLPKLKDVPEDMGGSGVIIPE